MFRNGTGGCMFLGWFTNSRQWRVRKLLLNNETVRSNSNICILINEV